MTIRVRRDLRVLVSVAALLAMALFATAALAQSTATLQGTVTDPQGAVVPNAKVTITDAEKGVPRVTRTNENGIYQMPSLPVGVYNVTVEAPGLQTQVANGLVLNAARIVVHDVKLPMPTGKEVVTVTSEAPIIERSTMTVGQVIDEKTAQEIPLNGRHFVDLTLLAPGTVTPPQSGFLTAPLRGQGSFGVNTAGNREDTVNFMINGINLNDMVQNQITFQPSINTVQEFKVDNSTYSAQYGRNSGAIVNIATRSGTNDFHGEIFDFLRNDALDARNKFNPVTVQKSPFKRNNFGANLGGPIIKSKLFFFGSYEGLRQRQGLTISSRVLSDNERAAVVDPTSQQLLQFIPTSNDPTRVNGVGEPNGFLGSGTAPVNIDQWTGDVQWVIGDSDNLHGYYAFQRDLRQEPTLQGNNIPGFGDTRASHRQILTINESHVFSPQVVNEARLGFNRIHITFTPNNLSDPTSFGINGGNSGPVGLPQISITSIGLNFGGPAGFPQGRGDATVVASDTLSWLRGKHSFKFGGEFRRFSNNNFNADTGTFNFADVAAFRQGTGNSFSVTPGSRPSRIYTGALGFFAMDSIKLTNRLTVELGLRWDWNMTPTEAVNRFVVFDTASGSLLQLGNGIDPVYQQNDHNFQPRLGFGWDIFGNGHTVLRAGYGLMVDQPVTNLVTGLASNPPLANPVNFSGPVTWSNAFTVAGAAGFAPGSVDPLFDNAYVQTWNVNLQQQITPTLAVMAGYFGSKGTHLRISRNINQRTGTNLGPRPFPTLVSSSTYSCPVPPALTCPSLGNIAEIDSGGISSYNALWLTATKRLSHGLELNGSYTWSKSLDYNSLSSQGVVLQDSTNPRGDYGLSDFDARHRFVVSALYELPFKGNRAVSGWQLSTIVQLQSGNPVNILATIPTIAAGSVNCPSNSACNIANFTGLATIRPDLIGTVQQIGTVDQWFTNTVCNPRAASCPSDAVFMLPISATGPVAFHFGDLGRNAIIGPNFKNVDFSVLKNTKITERFTFQWRTDFFNLFNRPNLGQPGRVAGSSTFGQITNTRFPTGDSGSSRQVQFAAKLLF